MVDQGHVTDKEYDDLAWIETRAVRVSWESNIWGVLHEVQTSPSSSLTATNGLMS